MFFMTEGGLKRIQADQTFHKKVPGAPRPAPPKRESRAARQAAASGASDRVSSSVSSMFSMKMP